MKKFAIIGFGGLGKTHFLNLIDIETKRGDIYLSAICNADISGISKNVSINLGNISVEKIDFSRYKLYTDYEEMIRNENLDFVFVALPSYMHAEVCIYCLNHAIDVYTEKPMAINLQQCEAMMEAAKKNNKKLMVGQSLRFLDEYIYLKDLIKNNTYGKPIKAEFSRKSPAPNWSFENWLLDERKSGGCIVDMHVHDVDIMMWLFGEPQSFHALTTNQTSQYESVYAIYKYPDMSVAIISDWGIHSSYQFNASYCITFEEAYVECLDGIVTVYKNDESNQIELKGENCFYKEVVEFIESVVDGQPFYTSDVNSVYNTMKLIFEEKAMLEKM